MKAFLRGFLLAMVLGFIPFQISAYSTTNTTLFLSMFSRILFGNQRITIYPTISLNAIILAFIISCPSQIFYFFYMTRMKSESIKGKMIIATIATFLIPLLTTIPPFYYFLYSFESFDWSDIIIVRYPAVVLVFLVFFPMIIRECKFKYHQALQKVTGINYKQQFELERREKRARIIGIGLAFTSLILPAVALVQIEPDAPYLENSYLIRITTFALFCTFDINNFSAIGNVWSFSFFSVPSFVFNTFIPVIIVIFNILFITRVIKHYTRFKEQSKVIHAGVLGMAWSTLVMSVYTFFIQLPPGSMIIPIPTPILFFVGLLVTYYKDPIDLLQIEPEIVEEDLHEAQRGDFISIPFIYVIYTHMKRAWNRFRNILRK